MATSFSVGKMNLAELPEDCIASIISHTSPLDATRLAGMCSTFRRASQFDTVWQNFLPCDYKSVCRSGQENQNKREIVMSLTEGVLLENGMQKYMLLRCSGGVCRKLSVAGMDVAWGQDSRFWKWDHSRSSCFGKVCIEFSSVLYGLNAAGPFFVLLYWVWQWWSLALPCIISTSIMTSKPSLNNRFCINVTGASSCFLLFLVHYFDGRQLSFLLLPISSIL